MYASLKNVQVHVFACTHALFKMCLTLQSKCISMLPLTHLLLLLDNILLALLNFFPIIGASLSEPHTGQTASPAIYYLSIYDLSYVTP